jgi:dienelactone hydrolase
MIKLFGWAALILVWASSVSAAVVGKTVEYKQGGTVLEGYLAYPDNTLGKVPGVIVVHEWNGLGDYAQSRARLLAELGYVAFAADIYGKGIRPTDVKGCAAESAKYKGDRKLMRARAKAAYDVLRKDPRVDAMKIAAIGYCFGGTVVLEMARSGLPLKGVASFHGGLDTPVPSKMGSIKAKVLILHGADDPFAPADQVTAVEKELKAAGADYQVNLYGGAQHGFTNPDNKGVLPGALYNEQADQRSWKALMQFFDEIFQSQ